MIKDITIGQYIPGESFIHKLDPRTKILITFLFIISLFIVDKFVGYIFVVAFLALVVYVAKISPRYLYKGLKPVFLLIALTAILNIFMLREGRLLFQLGFIKIYESGIKTALFMAIRLIPTLIDETDKIMKAQKARGADFESGGLVKKAKNLIPLLVPLFISSFRRADELAMAMEARCYRGGAGRTRMKVLKFTSKDFIAFGVFALLLASTLIIRFAI